jgi:pimeloyl-ACP methyl ester carboxylesterase
MKKIKKIATIIIIICVFFGVWTQLIVWNSQRKYPPIGSFIEKDGNKLHFLKSGSGDLIFLIHGDGGSIYDWKMSCFDTLTKHFTTIAIDRPGMGYSSTLENQSIEGQGEFIHQCMTKLSVKKPILICHSRGAEVGTYIALKYPNDIQGLITLGGSFINTEKIEPSWQYKLLNTPFLGKFVVNTFYIPFSKPFISIGLDKAFSPDKPSPEAYTDAYAALLMKPQTFLNWSRDNNHNLLEKYLIPNLPNIKTQLVIVNGEKDANIPVSAAQKLHKTVPNSMLIIIPNTGHEIQFNKPVFIFAAIDSLKKTIK